MKNIVQCKMCQTDFEYIPGPSGNARQLCKTCRDHVDEVELEEFKEQTIKEGNRDLSNKTVYDPIDILVDGVMPDFESDAEIGPVSAWARRLEIIQPDRVVVNGYQRVRGTLGLLKATAKEGERAG